MQYLKPHPQLQPREKIRDKFFTTSAVVSAPTPRTLSTMQPTLLIVDDEKNTREGLRASMEDHFDVYIAADIAGALGVLKNEQVDLLLTDLRLGGDDGMKLLDAALKMPRPPICIMMTAYGSVDTAVEAMKRGAYDFVTKPVNIDQLELRIRRALKMRDVQKENVELKQQVEKKFGLENMIGDSLAMTGVFDTIKQVAPSRATVLISGESGTGKELAARAIYHHSDRATQPFLAVNCAAIPEQLLESELFGHEKGAFTGATVQRIGKFEQCNKGTIFLDEIGDMTPATQTKILRVLQSGTFERVGGNSPMQVDVRVIAATNKPLEQAVAAKQFREDLFYRLNVVRIHLPPLRDRRDDIPLLVNYFLKKIAREQNRAPKSIATAAEKLLEKYHWPGNVRELENAIRRAHVMAKTDAILPGDLPPEISGAVAGAAAPPVSSAAGEAAGSDAATLARQLFQVARRDPKLKIIPAVERELVIQALIETNNNQVSAAKLLGITRATLRKRIEKFGIQRELNVK
jgi:two-component system, NtrC family, response regulator AtoC